MRGQRAFHVVRAVFDVKVLEDRFPSSVLVLSTLFGTCHFGRQALVWEQRLFPWRQVARFDDLFYGVLYRSFFLLVCSDVWSSVLVSPLFFVAPSARR